MIAKWFLLSLVLLCSLVAITQPQINPRLNKNEIKLFFEDGAAIDIKKIKYKGALRGVGTFVDEDSIFNMRSGLVLSSGAVKRIGRENESQYTSSRNWSSGYRRLTKIAKNKTKDASTIEITFVPQQDFISFNYVFGSDEYPEYVKSNFNDAFAFLLKGPNGKTTNLAVIPNTNDRIAVNSVNYLYNQEYYVNNSKLLFNFKDDVKVDVSYFWEGNKKYAVYITYNITAAITDDPKIPVEFDGFTKLLQAKAQVIPGKKYTLILTIADAGDRIYDSGVLIEAGSFNASNDENFKYGALAHQEGYYYTVDTVLVDSIPEEEVVIKPVCSDTTIDLFYPTNFYELTTSDKRAISDLISELDSSFQYQVYIDSYTDEVGTAAFNQVLSTNRSKIPQDFINSLNNPLIAEVKAEGHGIDPETDHSKQYKRRTIVRFTCLE